MIGPWARWERFATRRRGRQRQADGHTPNQTYDCQRCAHPWPCQPARLALLLGFEGDRIGLLMYLGAHLARALEQLPDTHPTLIVGQILHWVPRRR